MTHHDISYLFLSLRNIKHTILMTAIFTLELALAFIYVPEVLKMEHRTSMLMEAQMGQVDDIGSKTEV